MKSLYKDSLNLFLFTFALATIFYSPSLQSQGFSVDESVKTEISGELVIHRGRDSPDTLF